MALNFTFGKKMSRSDMIVMLTTLSWMIDAGLSVATGVDELLKDPNNKLNKNGLLAIQTDLNAGSQLSSCFREHEDIFGVGRWRQIDAAERTGKVADCLMRIANQIQSDGDLMGKVRSAVTYPAIIMLFALAAGYYMFTTVVPQMGDMLMEFNVELPLLTQIVMAISNFMINHVVMLVVGLLALVVLIRWLLTGPLKFRWHRRLTRLPFIGPVSVNMNYSLVYTLLCDMIENGAHVVEALRVASGSASNVFIIGELLHAADKMEREGLTITDALTKSSTMPADDKLMLQIGSRTGREMELLTTLSKRRREQAYASVNLLMEIMPTLVLLVVAFVVGTMVIAIYMPMISMATSIA